MMYENVQCFLHNTHFLKKKKRKKEWIGTEESYMLEDSGSFQNLLEAFR